VASIQMSGELLDDVGEGVAEGEATRLTDGVDTINVCDGARGG